MTDTAVLETAVVFLGASNVAALGILGSLALRRNHPQTVMISHHAAAPTSTAGAADSAPAPAGDTEPLPVITMKPAGRADKRSGMFVRADGSNRLFDEIRAEAAAPNGSQS